MKPADGKKTSDGASHHVPPKVLESFIGQTNKKFGDDLKEQGQASLGRTLWNDGKDREENYGKQGPHLAAIWLEKEDHKKAHQKLDDEFPGHQEVGLEIKNKRKEWSARPTKKTLGAATAEGLEKVRRVEESKNRMKKLTALYKGAFKSMRKIALAGVKNALGSEKYKAAKSDLDKEEGSWNHILRSPDRALASSARGDDSP